MDFDFTPLKGRIGAAFVENILRRAGYQVSRLGRDSQTQRLLKIGDDEFLPDFLVWKKLNGRPDSERFLHRLLMIEVKYQASLGEYLRRDADAVFSQVKEQWPELHFVFVTDNPEPARSCFQVVDLLEYRPDHPIQTVDLHRLRMLDIYPSTVAEYETLVRQIFSLLGAQAPVNDLRKSQAKAAGRDRATVNDVPRSEQSGPD
jgi:hypothetical protein